LARRCDIARALDFDVGAQSRTSGPLRRPAPRLPADELALTNAALVLCVRVAAMMAVNSEPGSQHYDSP